MERLLLTFSPWRTICWACRCKMILMVRAEALRSGLVQIPVSRSHSTADSSLFSRRTWTIITFVVDAAKHRKSPLAKSCHTTSGSCSRETQLRSLFSHVRFPQHITNNYPGTFRLPTVVSTIEIRRSIRFTVFRPSTTIPLTQCAPFSTFCCNTTTLALRLPATYSTTTASERRIRRR